jgi:hypothetical protein
MKHKLLLTLVVLLVLSTVSFAQRGPQAQCIQCSGTPLACNNSDQATNCRCANKSTGGCTACGKCVAGSCLIDCPPPIPTMPKGQPIPTMPKGQRRWLASKSLADEVAAHSVVMGNLIRSEQKDLSKKWCTQFRNGAFSTQDNQQVHWEMFLIESGVHYRIKETDETLDIGKDPAGKYKWILNIDREDRVVGDLH